MKAAVVLTPAMSKQLIAQGVAAHPCVEQAFQHLSLIHISEPTRPY